MPNGDTQEVFVEPRIMPSIPVNFDERLFYSIYSDSGTFKTSLALHFDNSVLPIYILMPITTFTYGRTYQKTYDENTGYLLAVSEIGNMAITFGFKELVKRKRPYNSLSGVRQKDKSTLDPYSFPSGHASSSFSIATMFVLRYPKYPQVYVPMYLWGLVVSWGRPYLGMHYPSDVLAGMLIGAGSSALVYSLRSELFRFKNNLLKEDKTDDGSINGGVISLFAGSFIVSEIFNTFIMKNNKYSLDILPGTNMIKLNGRIML